MIVVADTTPLISLLLMDEMKGRQVARQMGIHKILMRETARAGE